MAVSFPSIFSIFFPNVASFKFLYLFGLISASLPYQVGDTFLYGVQGKPYFCERTKRASLQKYSSIRGQNFAILFRYTEIRVFGLKKHFVCRWKDMRVGQIPIKSTLRLFSFSSMLKSKIRWLQNNLKSTFGFSIKICNYFHLTMLHATPFCN